jgi:ribose-phosphate pyrophosphokinase
VAPGVPKGPSEHSAWSVVATPQSSADALVSEIAATLGAQVLGYQQSTFGNENIFVDFDLDSLATTSQRVLIVAEGRGPTDGGLLELGLVADALKRYRPLHITCLLRYLPYSRSNRMTGTGTALGAKVYIDLLCSLPIDSFLTFDLHAAELLGFFTKPIHSLSALPLMSQTLQSIGRTYDLVVGTDRGRQDECFSLCDALEADLDFFTKRRTGHSGYTRTLERDLSFARGKRVLLFDDEIDSGRTAATAVDLLHDGGASSIDYLTIYDVAQPGAWERLSAGQGLELLARTNAALRPGFDDLPATTATVDLSQLVGDFLLQRGEDPGTG